MDTVQEMLRAAREMQRAGDVEGAARLFEDILSQEPGHTVSLHALGTLLNWRGDHARAVPLLERAVALRPGEPSFHIELGESYRCLGAYRDAIGCCTIGLKLRPEYPEGWNTLGLALRGSGDFEGALEKFLRALTCRDDFFPGHINAGLMLQELGRHERAIPHLRRAVELCPDSYAARTNLGLVLLESSRAEEALIHLGESVRLAPEEGIAHHNLGNLLRTLGRSVEARASYLKAIRFQPDLALSYFHVGRTLRLEGSLGEALRWHELSVEMEPDNPTFLSELADLYQKREDLDRAIEIRRRILHLTPGNPVDARLELGSALQADGRHPEALEQFLVAQQECSSSPQVHLALGGIYEEQGDMAAAEAEMRAALATQPRFPVAYARLATLLRGKLPDGDLGVIEDLLSDPTLGQVPRARLLFSLAHVLDARGDYTRAAACLKEANASTLHSRRAEGLAYDPDHHDRLVQGIMNGFDRAFFQRTSDFGLTTKRPVFVVGLPRSGTTLVEQILASHPRVFGAGERLFGRRSFEGLPAATGRNLPPAECVASAGKAALNGLAQQHLVRLNALNQGRSDRIVDKLPDNYLYIGLLYSMFPDSLFVHCRRDLRDVAVSCWMSDFRSIRWANCPEHIGSRFLRYRQLMEHWKEVFPGNLIEVNYEETVSDLEAVSRRLIEKCELEWHTSCLEFYHTPRVVRTASLTQVRQPIYTNSVARWRNYQDVLADLFALIAA